MYNKFVYKATKEGAFFFVKAINFHTSLKKRKTWKEEEELSKYFKASSHDEADNMKILF